MNRKTEALILILVGIIIISTGLYIYFIANTIYPNSASSRVQDMNWLLKTFGKLPLTILICIVGMILVYIGFKRLLKK